jgi:NAD(P)-dependent dehydrogenase (short-subunit alcohol dehydrogenase family)
MADEFDLTGKTALVLGGSSGIGRTLALGLRDRGATVLVAGRNPDKLAAVGAEIGEGRTYAAELTDTAAIGDLAAAVGRDHGTPDILVACQGTTVIKPALEVSEAEWDNILDTNLKSVFFSLTTFGRPMVARGSGSVITITSLAARRGWGNASAYAASKFGVAALTATLAAEWGAVGVRVNAIAPGFFLTDLNASRMSEARKTEAVRRTAMGRMGELPELVGAAVYLASDAARFVTGTTIEVDGGYLASGI